MGSYSATCAVSKLAIPGGTPIQAVLLTENPYGDGWDLRAPPIRARYNDYGNIEDLRAEDAAIARLWLQALDVDLAEQGVGDNQSHDVATRRGMSFEALCEALQEGRVLVRQDATTFWRPPNDGPSLLAEIAEQRVKEESWRPTMASVEAVLGAHAGLVNIDQPIGNVVRVRKSGFGAAEEVLTDVREKLSGHFAVVMTAGSGNYGFDAELLGAVLSGTLRGDLGHRARPLRTPAALRTLHLHLGRFGAKCNQDGTVEIKPGRQVEPHHEALALDRSPVQCYM